MAYSHISYCDEHIRVKDFDLIALVYLMKSAALQIDRNSILDKVFAAWIDSIENGGAGNIDLQLDSLLTEPEDHALLLCILDQAEKQLAQLPDVLTTDFLRDLIQLDGVKFGNYKKSFLECIALQFRRLLEIPKGNDLS